MNFDLNNGYGKNSIKYQLTQIFQEAALLIRETDYDNEARLCIMSMIKVKGISYPKCKLKYVSGKRFVCKKCAKFYNKLKATPFRICKFQYNFRVCRDMYQGPYEVCEKHHCYQCVKERNPQFHPAYAVVCARMAGLPPLPKEIWRIIFEFSRVRLIRVSKIESFYHNPLAFTNENLFPDMLRIPVHNGMVFCRSHLMEGCMKSNKCRIVTGSLDAICIECRGLSTANGKKFYYLGAEGMQEGIKIIINI